jgi:hypothetical protein
MRILRFEIVLLIGTVLFSFQLSNAYAHNFYQNKDSIFFALIKQFEIEKNLASDNLASNKSAPLKHSENADRLFSQLVSLNKAIPKNSNFVNKYDTKFNHLNLTTKALVTANLADQSLKQYGLSNGLDKKSANDLLNMSTGMIMKMNRAATINMSNDALGQKVETMPTMPASNHSLNGVLNEHDEGAIYQVNYETSTELAKSLKKLFSDNLENARLQNSSGLMHIPINIKVNSVKELGQGIDNLILALNRNASLHEVSSIVHGQIHPNLFLAFDLKLKGE